MRAPAQVLPAQVAGLGVEVVVDRQLARADLGGGSFGGVGGGSLEADQLDLVGLGGEFGTRLVVGDDPAGEALALLLDLLHALLDAAQILGVERLLDVEVVVEAVLDGRADPELGLGEQVLHGLGEDVGGGVPQDVQTVGGAELDRLDLVAVGERMGEIAQLTADPGGHDGALALEERGGRGARGHHALFPLGIALDDHTDV